MTNLEDDDITQIKHAMQNNICKDTIANIIDADQIVHFFIILWAIRNDQLKPLRWPKVGR